MAARECGSMNWLSSAVGSNSHSNGILKTTAAQGNSQGAAPADGQRGRATTIRLLQAAMVAALAVPILLFMSASYISYRNIRALADERIERSLDVEGEQALKVLQSANLAFIAIDDVVAGRTAAEIESDATNLRDRLKGIAG